MRTCGFGLPTASGGRSSVGGRPSGQVPCRMRHRSFWDSEGPPGLCPSSIILGQPLSLDTLCAPTASFPTLCQTPPAAWHHGSCYSPLHGVPLSQPGRILWEPLKGTEWPGGRCPASSYAQNQPAWCCRDCSAGPLAGLVPGRRAGPGPPGAACSRSPPVSNSQLPTPRGQGPDGSVAGAGSQPSPSFPVEPRTPMHAHPAGMGTHWAGIPWRAGDGKVCVRNAPLP